jgi:hypothetical protein
MQALKPKKEHDRAPLSLALFTSQKRCKYVTHGRPSAERSMSVLTCAVTNNERAVAGKKTGDTPTLHKWS